MDSNIKVFWLIIHFIGLGIAFGIGVAALVLGKYARSLPEEQRPVIGGAMRKLFMVGPMGLALLIISGIFLSLNSRSDLLAREW